ncbi:MAG: hypothetical protein EKK41_21330 [Hyphomicrobiales bacterium]|nr:MAG: hypothetical protein EKK41_21330 [Hyphomicrobiales bacterium]
MVGFARMFEERPVIAAGVRLPLTLLADEGAPLVPADRWQDTVIRLPAELAGRHFRDLLTGREVVLSDKGVRVAALLACFPVALLVAEP